MRRFPLLLATFALSFVWSSQCAAQIPILHKKKPVDKSTAASNNVEPDKQLYDKAMTDIKHGRYEVGRLGLQTLINTYPDSEFLAKAKLAIADSYFKQGGTSNTTQAIAGYKDFIVFFPFLPEAAYAQMQVAMANYNEMTKADRDSSHALDAEAEFQTFLEKYPKDPLAPQAEQRLREVQEVLAEGQYRIAYYYYLKGDRRAAAGRLIPLVKRYPLYSKSDTALWMLGSIYEKAERKDFAGQYYSQIVKNYPLSPKADDARAKLKDFGMPVPQPDPTAVAWMKAEQNTPRPKESLLHKPVGFVHGGPDVRMAAAHGTPNLMPESDEGNTDVLSGGNHTTIANSPAGGTAPNSGTGIVGTVKPGEPAPAGSAPAEDVNSTPSTDPPTASNNSSATSSSTDQQANGNSSSTDSNSSNGTSSTATTNGTSNTSTSGTTDASKSDNTQPAADGSTNNSNQNQNGKESSSKKKGLKKLLPW